MQKLFAIRYSLNAHSRAFTLIELVVVVGIFIAVSSLILANNSRFGGSVLLQNLAYDIALSIRQAQVYGIAVRGAGSSNFSSGYGMYFESASGKNKTYVLFADVYPAPNGNGLYDSAPGADAVVSSTDIGRGYMISKLCSPANIDGSGNCLYEVSRLDILFKRPEPDADIRAGGAGGVMASGRIVISSPRGDSMSIVVDQNGQISVQK